MAFGHERAGLDPHMMEKRPALDAYAVQTSPGLVEPPKHGRSKRLDATNASVGLRMPIIKAIADPTVKAQLKRKFDSGQMKTNDSSLDQEIDRLLS
jgi:hypothetical protein